MFLGWNTFDDADFQHLLHYVEGGGTLLLTRQHLSCHVVRKQPSAPPRLSAALERLLGPLPIYNGKVERRVGCGRVIYFPHDAYPSDPALRATYTEELRELGARAARAETARGWVCGSEDVEFAAYDWAGGRLRTIYLLDIDWWSGSPGAPATFLLGAGRFELAVPAGTIRVITACPELAVMPEAPDADVLDLTPEQVVVQSDAGTRLRLFDPSCRLPEWIDVPAGGVQVVQVG